MATGDTSTGDTVSAHEGGPTRYEGIVTAAQLHRLESETVGWAFDVEDSYLVCRREISRGTGDGVLETVSEAAARTIELLGEEPLVGLIAYDSTGVSEESRYFLLIGFSSPVEDDEVETFVRLDKKLALPEINPAA